MNTYSQSRAPYGSVKRPDATKEMLTQAMECHRSGRLSEAARRYENILRIDPRNSDALHLLGLIRAAEGQIEGGIELIQQAVIVQPNFPAAFFNLGNLLERNGRAADAISAYKRATCLQPKFPEAHCNLGCVLLALGKHEEAIMALRRAIAEKKNFAEPYYNLGLAYHQLGRLEDAGPALLRAVELKPDNSRSLRELGLVLKAQNKFSDAATILHRSVMLNPSDAQIWFDFGICLHRDEKLEEAVSAYRRAIELQPELTKGLRLLKLISESHVLDEDRRHEAQLTLAATNKLAPVYSHLGAALLVQGKIAESVNAWREISPFLSLSETNRCLEPAKIVEKRLHTTRLETAEIRVSLDFNIILTSSNGTVTVCAPSLLLINTGANELEVLRQLDLDILKKVDDPISKMVHPAHSQCIAIGHTPGLQKKEFRETISDSHEYLQLFAQQLMLLNRTREALECLRGGKGIDQPSAPHLEMHGLLAATDDSFEESIGLFRKAMAIFFHQGDGENFWRQEGFLDIANLLEQASAIYGVNLLPTTTETSPVVSAPVASSMAYTGGGNERDDMLDQYILLRACNDLAEGLINHHNDFRRACTVYSLRRQFQLEYLRTYGIEATDTLFLGHDWVRNVGHIAFLGHLIKMQELGLSPWRRIVLLARNSEIANLAYLNQWRRYLIVVTDPKEVSHFTPLTVFCGFCFSTLIPFLDREPLYNSELAAAVEEKWEAAARPPLLTLEPSDKAAGRQALSSLGVKPGEWFVCLHVRASGFHKVKEEQRDAALEDYFKAIETITSRGGWVIRMGDASMAPLPVMDHVIDYPHTSLKSGAMDVFLCAECRFFIGMHSGLSHVPYSFGRPTVMTNWLNTGSLPPYPRDGLFLPKMIRLTDEQRLLPLQESLGVHWGARCYGTRKLAMFKAELVNNTPDEIDEIVREMLDRLDGIFPSSENDGQLQEKFISSLPRQSKGAVARIGTAFLRRHQSLL